MKAYLVIGIPASGKTWVCTRLSDVYEYWPHDDWMFYDRQVSRYVEHILSKKNSPNTLLIETPFSITAIKAPLEAAGMEVIPVFIVEKPEVILTRYNARGKRDMPLGNLRRQETYEKIADEWRAFKGTSTEVLKHLVLAHEQSRPYSKVCAGCASKEPTWER